MSRKKIPPMPEGTVTYELTTGITPPGRRSIRFEKLRATMEKMEIGDSFFTSDMTRNNINNVSVGLGIYVSVHHEECNGVQGLRVFRIEPPENRKRRKNETL